MKRLDLHGLRHEEARRAVIRFVEDNWGSDVDAQIITGHSQKMCDIVLGVLNEYKLDYPVNEMFRAQGYISTKFE